MTSFRARGSLTHGHECPKLAQLSCTLFILFIFFSYFNVWLMRMNNESQFDYLLQQQVAQPVDEKPGSIPILMNCKSRPHFMNESIHSLMGVRGVDPSKFLLLQDGDDAPTVAMASQLRQHFGFTHEINNLYVNEADKSSRLALHFKYAIGRAFELFADAPALIIMEDDLVSSPDLMEYFQATFGVLKRDPTLFCVSAWNDQGRKGLVQDPYELRRTGHFPGLGWMILRDFWDEVGRVWPTHDWDMVLRSDVNLHKYRQCIYPEIPRTYHIGKSGTFMDDFLQKTYFDTRVYNTDKTITWVQRDLSFLFLPHYQHSMVVKLRTFTSIREAQNVVKITAPSVLWYRIDWEVSWRHFARVLSLWHEKGRSEYNGIHEIRFNGVKLLLVNVDRGMHSMSRYRPPSVPVFVLSEFMKASGLEEMYQNIVGSS